METDLDTIDSSSITSDETTNESIFSLTQDELNDITIDIYELFDSYLENNILQLSSPSFYDEMFYTIAYMVMEEWVDANLCGETKLESVLELVKETFQTYQLFTDKAIRSLKTGGSQKCLFNLAGDKEKIEKTLGYLRSIPQPEQRTTEWYEFRNGLITASNIWKIFGTESQFNSLIYEKCKPTVIHENQYVNTESPLHWGVKYEPVTVMLYELINQTKVGEFGCIQHANYPFIGASPDGINIDPTNEILYGRMLEIKNIFNREITGIPKMEYWIQTQVQMETCDLDECDFLETRIVEYTEPDAFYSDTDRKYKGVILYFLKNGEYIPNYCYMPIQYSYTREEIEDWIQKTKTEWYNKNKYILYSTIYWYLDEYSCVFIPRNRAWFNTALPKIESAWNTIVKEKVDGYEHRASKKRALAVSNEASNTPNTLNSLSVIKLE